MSVLDDMWRSYETEYKKPAVEESGGGFFGFFGKKAVEEPVETVEEGAPKNVYLHGTVGTGKSFLMDLFYEEITDSEKKRVHFHDFMIDVHQKIHRWRLEEKSATNVSSRVFRSAEKVSNVIFSVCLERSNSSSGSKVAPRSKVGVL